MDTARLCLTGAERTATALADRLDQEPDLHEVRLDLLERIDDEVFTLLERHASRVIATCRPTREGGGFTGDESDRIAILQHAARADVAWLDLELDLWESGEAETILDSTRCGTIASVHDFEGGMDRLPDLARRLTLQPATVAKLAIHLSSVRDLGALRDLTLARPSRVVIGMGAAGLWTRLRPDDFGSAWTYVVPDAALGTAPGQVTMEQAIDLQVPRCGDLRPIAVAGDERVIGSQQVRQLARACAPDPYQVLPLVISAADVLRSAARTLGLAGIAVEPPFRRDAAALCDHLDARARAAGAVDTIALGPDGSWRGANVEASAPDTQPPDRAALQRALLLDLPPETP